MTKSPDPSRLAQRLQEFFEKGAAAYQQGNDTYAIELLLRVVRSDPLFTPARALLRAAERRASQAHSASWASPLLQLLLYPFKFLRFSLTQAQGKAREALVMAESILRSNPHHLPTLKRISKLAEREGWIALAAQAYEDIWAAQPENLDALVRLGELHRELQDPEKAHFFLQKAAGLAPHDPRVLRQLKDVDALGTLRRGGWAEQASRSKRPESPSEPDPQDAHPKPAAGEQPEEKIRRVQEKIQRFPNDLALRLEAGRLLCELGRTDEAVSQLQVAVKGPAQQGPALHLLGRCFQAKRMLDLAIEQYEKALERSEIDHALRKEILYELGTALEQGGQQEKALKIFKQIYGEDIHYRDVAQRIERAYKDRGHPS